MKPKCPELTDGAALILAISVLALLVLALGSILSVSLSRRQRIQKELSRDLADIHTRSVLLNLKPAMVEQIKQTGAFEIAHWKPIAGKTLLSTSGQASGTSYDYNVQATGTALVAANPSLQATTQSNGYGFLEGLACGTVGRLAVSCRWEPGNQGNNNRHPSSTLQISTSVTVTQVPLSAFTFYSSSLRTVAGGSHRNLGRAYSEGDLAVTSFVDASAAVGVAGALRVNPQGGIIIRKSATMESRAFGSSTTPEDLQAQGNGWIFERDSNPVVMVRPVTTAELFSKTPIAYACKEKQRLKPLCDLCIRHGSDNSGSDVFTFTGSSGANDPARIGDMVRREGSTLELDFSKLNNWTIWPSKIWIETDRPEITAVLVKNAERLKGDLSLATDLHIQVSGSFNTELPVRKASLLTKGRVTCVP